MNILASKGAGGLTCGLGGPTVAVLRARGPRGPAGPIAQQIADPTCNEWQRERCTLYELPSVSRTKSSMVEAGATSVRMLLGSYQFDPMFEIAP